MSPRKRQYSYYEMPASLSNGPTCMMRLSHVLKYLVLFAFGAMILLSGYIFFNFFPTFENGQLVAQRWSPVIKARHDAEVIFAPRVDLGNLSKGRENFREHYNQLYDIQPVAVGPDFIKDKNKYFIYRCDTVKLSGCDDWADHIKGIEAAYLIANLTGRVFKVEIYGFPCKLSDYVYPNIVNWTHHETFHPVLNKGMAGISIRNFDNSHSFYNNLYKLELSEIAPENFEHVYFKSNLDFISGFKNSTVYKSELSWMRQLGRDVIHASLYKRLFFLAPGLQKRLELFLYSILPSPEHRLICLDLGTRKNWSSTNENDLNSQRKHLLNIWSFIKTHSNTNIDKVFINTDSQEILSWAKTETFRSRLVTSPKKKSSGDGRSQQLDLVCESLESDIFNQHVLVNCDVLVVSSNSLGHLAAYLRGTDNGLYCLMGNGHIHPCRADTLNELYSIHE
uniref:Uncharacterized protein n=1 Tax=Arion vulgaris TaxID=1028688 RepID=A0A0B6ZW61_9EUPU